MFAKLKNEMQQNEKLKYAIIIMPFLVLFAAYSLYSEFGNKNTEIVAKKNSSKSQNVKIKKAVASSKQSNKTRTRVSSKGKKIAPVVSSKTKYAKMSLKDLKKEKEKLEKEKQSLEKIHQDFIAENKDRFWLYSKDGDPLIALPTMIEKVAKELDLKISSLSSIRRSKGSGYDTVEVSISCMNDMETIVKFLNKLESGSPKISWSKSSLRPYRSKIAYLSFSGTANVLLLTDPEIGTILQGQNWKTPPADVKSRSSRSSSSKTATSRTTSSKKSPSSTNKAKVYNRSNRISSGSKNNIRTNRRKSIQVKPKKR